jgi:hypothetical protein
MWLALFLISISWLFSLPIYIPENYAVTAVLIAAGLASACVALRKSKIDLAKFNKRYYLLLLPLAISWLLLRFPYNLGTSLLFIGLAIVPLYSRWRWSSALALGLFFSGAILIVQSAIPHLYAVFTSKSHSSSFLSPVIYQLLSFLNLPVSYSQGTVFVGTMRELYAFTTTWDKMALFPFLNLLVAGGILLWLFSRETVWRRKALSLSLFVIVGAIYVIVRYIFMVLLFVHLMYYVGYYEDISRMDIFWSAPVTAASFLPWLLLVWKLFPLKDTAGTIRGKLRLRPLNGRHLMAGALLCLSAFLMVGSIGFHDPGKDKQGRILIDEKHSTWEPTTKKYDTEWYGQDSGYNYYCMAEYLNYYYRLDRNFQDITPDLLSDYDVLILKVPTAAYSREEVEAVVQFVRKGGGLWLLGEHTNYRGSGEYLNSIARRFNFAFRYDCLFDNSERKFEQVYIPPRDLPHPIVQNMPPFLFAVSCSIEPGSYCAEKAILSSRLYALPADYHMSNFYPLVKYHTYMDFGYFAQMMAVKYGKGRVAAFTDSTVFSNFSAFIPGKPELLLGTINWLNKENQLRWLNFLFLALAIISFALAFVVLGKSPKDWRFISIVVVSGICIIALAISLFSAITRASYPLPEPHTRPTNVYFEKEHGNYELPLLGFTQDHKKSYEIFYQWVLRLGYFPGVGPSIQACTERGDLVVIINPQKAFTIEEIDSIKEFLSRGGKVLLMDSPLNTGSSANSLVQAFGMSIKPTEQTSFTSIADASGKSSWPIGGTFINVIQGGKGLLFAGAGKPVLAVAKEGKGTLAVMTLANSFVNSEMGTTEKVVPDERLLRKFRLEFAILRGLINDNLEVELSAAPGGT